MSKFMNTRFADVTIGQWVKVNIYCTIIGLVLAFSPQIVEWVKDQIDESEKQGLGGLFDQSIAEAIEKVQQRTTWW